MTIDEAIKIIKGMHSLIMQTNISIADCNDYKIASKLAIEALEKQIPKEPISKIHMFCPNCKELIVSKGCYCRDCGQRLDWSGENDD